MDTTLILSLILGAIVPIFSLVLKWALDFISSERQYTRDRKRIILQRQLEVMEDAMAHLLGMWKVLYSLKSVMEKFTSEPTLAQIELLQKAIDGVNGFQEKSKENKNAILLYYDFSGITKEFELNKIDSILLELSDIISLTFARMAEMKSKGYSIEQIKVEAEHIANSYHLYADAIKCKMNSIVAMQDFLRREIKK
ncbi:MAG: hypothetical protein MJZ63_00340 [Muribaculaceae bacterium]|nr:hypothetical protein [Muribaculaceae bacterium]